MISDGIFTLLSRNPSVSALVGTRVYPVRLPTASALPAITYKLVGGHSDPTLDTSGLQSPRWEFHCWGMKYADANVTRKALIELLNGYQGSLADGEYLQNVELIQSVDFDEPDALQYRCMVEFYLHFDFSS